MKPTFIRRHRRNRHVSRTEGAFFKKESDSTFFDTQAPSPFFAAAPVAANGTLQRKCDKCNDEEKLQRQESSNSSGKANATSSELAGTNGGGSSLPESSGKFFSNATGADLSEVKIHTGTDADHSAKAVNAKAYTIGNNIVFANGQYQPDTHEGKKLLAHELAHVVQQKDGEELSRKVAPHDELQDEPKTGHYEGVGSKTENMVNHGKGYCEGVNVQGKTTANYKNSFSAISTDVAAEGCTGCGKKNCITSTGTVESVFTAAPKVTLPAVPGGLNKCEQAAIKLGISTVLAAHEQEHVNAFNTYVGTESTAYTYTGCKSGLKKHLQQIHDGIEVPRRNAANAESAALDPFNAVIDCDCPPPEPAPAKVKKK